MKLRNFLSFVIFTGSLAACGDISQVGKRPPFSPITSSSDYYAMNSVQPSQTDQFGRGKRKASLWHSGPTSLLGDRRASTLGDLLTVVIQINDKAEISNSSTRSRKGSETMGIPQFLGISQQVDAGLPTGASSAKAIDFSSNSTSSGNGSVRRKEKLTLRVAATVTDVLANGYLNIQGSQEVRVNFELRELLVTGFVRPEDISRKNEITYDKIASARISYGGRGQISSAQQSRYGQQVFDLVSPF